VTLRSPLLVLLSVLAGCRAESPVAVAQATPAASASPSALRSPVPPVVAVPTGPLLDIVTVGEGGCVLRRDGRVTCWKVESASRAPTAKDVPELADVVSLSDSARKDKVDVVRRSGAAGAHSFAFGAAHTTIPLAGVAQIANRCVRLQTGAVSCDCLSGWMALPFVSSAVDLAKTGNHACVASQSGDVTCWGQRLGGVLGVDPQPEPTMTAQEHVCPSEHATTRFGDVVQVAVSNWSSCARHRTGEIDCWGAEGPKPVRISVRPSTSLRSGPSATCSIDREGHADCWGDFRYPTLDDGTRRPHKPTRLPLEHVTAIDTEVTCAIVDGARVVCWDVRAGCEGASCLSTYEVMIPG
jgi:hypothetical protein